MKIEGGIHPLTGPQRKEAVDRSAKKNTGPGAAREEDGAFNVKLSATTEQLLSAVPAEEEVRWEKVESIRNQLASGTYNISGKDVADKILNALKG